MIDGDPATAWSNYYLKDATALLPAFSLAHPREWVSVAWPGAQSVSSVRAAFTIDATHALPADIGVRYWDGTRWVGGEQRARRAGHGVRAAHGDHVRSGLDHPAAPRPDERAPEGPDGFVAISELEVPGVALH